MHVCVAGAGVDGVKMIWAILSSSFFSSYDHNILIVKAALLLLLLAACSQSSCLVCRKMYRLFLEWESAEARESKSTRGKAHSRCLGFNNVMKEIPDGRTDGRISWLSCFFLAAIAARSSQHGCSRSSICMS